MLDASTFQREFGAALAGRHAVAYPALARAVAVHRNTATKAAADALAANFPVVRALVGEDAFTAAARAFVEVHPPAEPRLCLYGAGFPAFIAGYGPFRTLPYLADVGTVERLVVEALFAADAVPLAPNAIDLSLDAVPTIHPALRVATFATPAASIWLAHQPDSTVPAGEIEWGAETVLVSRPDLTVSLEVVPQGAEFFINACRAGGPLGAAAMAAGDELPHIFAFLIAAGAFAPSALTEGAPL